MVDEHPLTHARMVQVQWRRARIRIDRQELARLRRQGWTLKRIGEHFGVGQTSLKEVLYGLPKRRR